MPSVVVSPVGEEDERDTTTQPTYGYLGAFDSAYHSVIDRVPGLVQHVRHTLIVIDIT